MSIKQMETVFKDISLKGNEKLLMLALADNANDSGVCFPSWNSLIQKTSMSKGSVSKWLKELENNKLVFRVSRNRKNGSRTSNKYLIYPFKNKDILDVEDYILFKECYQSSEVELVQELNYHSSEVELPIGGQSSEVEHLEPSLSSNRNYNHHSKKSGKQKHKPKNKKDSVINILKEYDLSSINEQALNEWMEYKKFNYEKIGITKLVNMLVKYPKEVQQQMVDKSIMNNYQGIFEIKQQQPQQQYKSKSQIENERIDDYFAKQRGDVIDTEIMGSN